MTEWGLYVEWPHNLRAFVQSYFCQCGCCLICPTTCIFYAPQQCSVFPTRTQRKVLFGRVCLPSSLDLFHRALCKTPTVSEIKCKFRSKEKMFKWRASTQGTNLPNELVFLASQCGMNLANVLFPIYIEVSTSNSSEIPICFAIHSENSSTGPFQMNCSVPCQFHVVPQNTKCTQFAANSFLQRQFIR